MKKLLFPILHVPGFNVALFYCGIDQAEDAPDIAKPIA